MSSDACYLWGLLWLQLLMLCYEALGFLGLHVSCLPACNASSPTLYLTVDLPTLLILAYCLWFCDSD